MTPGGQPSATVDLLRSLLRHGWLFALALVPAGLLLVTTPAAGATWIGSGAVAVRPPAAADVGEMRQFEAYTRRHVDTFAQLATTSAVLDDVTLALDLDTSARDLASRVAIVHPENREMVSFEIASPDRDEARTLAAGLSEALAARIEVLSPREEGGGTLVSAEVLAPSISQGDPGRSLLLPGLLAVVGLGAAAAWVLLRFATDDVLRTPEELADLTTAPVLATFRSGRPDERAEHLLRLHLDGAREDAVVQARLVGTTPAANEAFAVRDRLLRSFGSSVRTAPHIEVVRPDRIATVPDALVVTALRRTTGTQFVRLVHLIESHGGNVDAVIAHQPRRAAWASRLLRRIRR